MRSALASHDMRTVLVLLQERGMSQRALAEHTGFAQSEIQEILRTGRQVRSYDVLARAAEGLGVERWRMGLSYNPPAAPDCTHCASIRTPAHDRSPLTAARSQPGELPPRWWDQPDLIVALAGHDFAAVFAHLRSLGLSSHDIATRTGLQPSHVESVLAGRGTVTAYNDILAVCHGLNIDRGAAGIAYLAPSPADSDRPPDAVNEPGLPPVWTGAHIQALRIAMRHSVASFAARMDVSERAAQMWETGGRSVKPRRPIQLRLDALYGALRPQTRALYVRLLTSNGASAQPAERAVSKTR